MMEVLAVEAKESLSLPEIRTGPRSMDLFLQFQDFIQYWAGAKVEYRGRSTEVSPDLPVEVAVRWAGSVGGTLVLRCRSSFRDWLAESRRENSSDSLTPKATFHEMATLYGVYLIQCFWMSESFELGPVLPRPSTPKDWPTREPNATCNLKVGQEPVEIRLWVN